jgi:hypothetical protein
MPGPGQTNVGTTAIAGPPPVDETSILSTVTISQSDLLRARLSPRYRAGIWLTRLGYLVSWPLMVWSLLDESREQFFYLGWALGAAAFAPAGWLLFTAIRRLHRGPLQTFDHKAIQPIWKDQFLPKPKA